MEEERAAAYYDELTRKGEGAAKFKRGLGFASNDDDQNDVIPQRGSAFVSSSSSFLGSFVRASSPNTASKLEKESQLQSIQNKLKKKPEREARVLERSSGERDRDRYKDRHSGRRSRSRSRERYRERRRRRSRSWSPRRDRRSRSRSPPRDRRSGSRRSRSLSPRERRRSERDGEREGKSRKEKKGAVDYSRLIEGYDKMV